VLAWPVVRALRIPRAEAGAVERLVEKSFQFRASRESHQSAERVVHSRTRPYRPATNAKVERFNRTLLAEWDYARPWSSEGQRTSALTAWLHLYNHQRHHTAIGGPPITRVSNLPGHYS
jgi:transposase InsO family protein